MSWDWENSTVDDYGGGADKLDHREGTKPHALGVYRALQSGQGSAFSKQLTGILHAENLAEARCVAALMQAAEKLQTNSFPSRADEALQYWVDILDLSVGAHDTDNDVRRKAQAKYQSLSGNDAVSVETAVRTLLGDTFVSIERNGGGAMDTPSHHTYWPGVNPGPQALDMDGTGAWLSDNAHILVLVSDDQAVNKAQAQRTYNVDLVSMLDDMLPAWATFEWAYEQCFLVESSLFNQAAICEA